MGYDYSGDVIGGPSAIGAAAGRADASKMFIADMEQPVSFWTPAVVPSGMTFYTGDLFPKWRNLFVGVLKHRRLECLVVND